jgi:hypothetical protein
MLRMDTMTSTEFRRRYAFLTRPTIVTVNGRLLGRWMPGAPPVDAVDIGGEAETRPVGLRPEDVVERFNTRPFTPVPKHK